MSEQLNYPLQEPEKQTCPVGKIAMAPAALPGV
jgi:hypothetical protein